MGEEEERGEGPGNAQHSENGGEKKQDERLSWFERRINAALKVKPAVMDRLVRGDEFFKQVHRFCDQGRSLYVVETQTGDLEACVDLPGPVKKKALLFYKRKDESVSPDRLKNDVCFVELGSQVLVCTCICFSIERTHCACIMQASIGLDIATIKHLCTGKKIGKR
jgi:hypothetical protein